jgi:hypothetical protein
MHKVADVDQQRKNLDRCSRQRGEIGAPPRWLLAMLTRKPLSDSSTVALF